MLFVYSTIFVLGDVRLVGTGLKHVEKVELRYQKEWGTVCNGWYQVGSTWYSYWGKKDADVICRMLGYKAAVVPIYKIEGETPRRMLMYNVGCSGNEKSIADCTHNGWWPSISSYSDCSSYPTKTYAGVLCQTVEGKKDKYLLHYNCKKYQQIKGNNLNSLFVY